MNTPHDIEGAYVRLHNVNYSTLMSCLNFKQTPTPKFVSNSESYLVNYNHIIFDCECEVLNKVKYIPQSSDFVSQSVLPFFGAIEPQLNKFVANKDGDFFIKLIEDLSMFSYQLISAKGKSDYILAIVTFAKLRTSGSLLAASRIKELISYFEKIFSGPELQSIDECFKDIRSYLDKYAEVRNAPIFKKVYKFLMYALSLSIFDKIGLSFDNLNYSKVEAEALKRKYHMGPDFVHSLLDTLVFICERGYQCMKTGTMDPIYHSGAKYEEWFNHADVLKRQSTLLSNPEPHGICKFSYIADLKDAIEKGQAIYKHSLRLSEIDRRFVKNMLSDLLLIQSTILTKREAQKDRKAPFSVLVYGGSSVAKSTLTKILFYHYGKLFDLPTDPEYKYTRNPVDPFWSNFNSTQWCVQLDDIAFMHPNKAVNGDPSMMEMLQVINNVPYVPTQADIVDKGRTPMMSKLVIATTNTQHLNAQAYFACPLAVQRRLPWIIDVTPKKEYLKDGCMLDGTKVPVLQDGEYPDYWVFHVKRVVPLDTSRENQKATYQTVDVFENINDFVRWFSKEAIKYEALQDKTVECDSTMANITICKDCYLPSKHCECMSAQTSDIVIYTENLRTHPPQFNVPIMEDARQNDPSFLRSIKQQGLFVTMRFYFYYFIIFHSQKFTFIYWLLTFLFGPCVIIDSIANLIYDIHMYRAIFHAIGEKVGSKIGKNKRLTQIAYLVTIYIVTFKATKYIMSWLTPKPMKPEGANQSKSSISADIGSRPEPIGEERQNIWYKDDYQISSFDVDAMSTSYSAMSEAKISDIILRNCVHFTTTRLHGDGVMLKPTRAFCISGHIYICNNHAIPDVPTMELKIISSPHMVGVNTNLTIQLSQCEVFRYPELDLAFVRIRNLPPRKNLVNLFCKNSLKGSFPCKYLARNLDGSSFTKNVHKVVKKSQVYNEILDTSIDSWYGIVDESTQAGDCGSILLSRTGYGPIILGIHYLGSVASNHIASINVTQEFLKQVLMDIDPLNVEAGLPELSSPSAPRILGALHSKSPIRFAEQGSAEVFGSFVGFRPKTKSSVAKTALCDVLVSDYDYVINHGAPEMKSWVPGSLALNQMIHPVTKLDSNILAKCVKGYTDDVLSELHTDQLRQVVVYDNFTAVNGAAGVAYVDKMNRNTSAGNPWKKSKKYFITLMEGIEDMQDPVEVCAEIMDRVDDCIEKYKQKARYNPAFCAHLKDEALSLMKVNLGKTRVFTGSPFDWNIVVRKYLLAFIRLVQSNKFAFESGPGTVAQSLEWELIREYLTHFGDKHMIAGDYEKFDKKMSPVVILSAFDAIIIILKAAGYSDEELGVVQCIAEDTAFPLVDFFGDLIMFFGSNPSGHPLTVIINGIVNSLYVRYCYCVLSPDGECIDFKKNVHLMTYGDDNCMGVNPKCTWFTHTAIQKVLADVGIGYTMADKAAESVPYIHINEVSFLKRSWRWDSDADAYLCPLELESIHKMLTMCVYSKAISLEEQALNAVEVAMREYFFYGKTRYNAEMLILRDVVQKCNLNAYITNTTFVDFDVLLDQFNKSSQHVILKRQRKQQKVFVEKEIDENYDLYLLQSQ